jgi:beta-glucanase (GH16 family)
MTVLMKRILLFGILAALTFGINACGKIQRLTSIEPIQTTILSTRTETPMQNVVPSETPISAAEPSGWKLVWQDEFDGLELNPKNWTFDIGGEGWGNNELEYYTDQPENLYIENGMLVIEARAEKFNQNDYTSARIKTQGLQAWTYGRFEARMKIPAGQGLWPAFWLLGTDIPQNGWPGCGEIDVMENIGKEPLRVHGSAHGQGYSGGNSLSGYLDADSALSNDFHIYAVEWDPDRIRWFLDDKEYFSVLAKDVPGKWAFDHPYFIILNLAIGGNWPGLPDETTVFPQQLLVDYVRVYQRSE